MQPLIARRQEAKPKAEVHDPAPARWRYRVQRLWLTPLFRALLRTGIPAFGAVLAIVWYIGDPTRLEVLIGRLAEVRQSIEERPEFMVRLVQIEGASPELAQDIREVLPVDLPVSQFDFDLDLIRAALEDLDPIRAADVRIKAGGVLVLRVTERTPAVVFLSSEGPELLDGEGHRVASLSQQRQRGALPVVAGPGAETEIPEALRLIAAAAPIRGQLKGLVRVGARRWDVVLTGDRRIYLPEVDPGLALDKALALQAAQDVLSRDIVAVDLRNRHRPTLRMSETARNEMRRMQELERLSSEDDG